MVIRIRMPSQTSSARLPAACAAAGTVEHSPRASRLPARCLGWGRGRGPSSVVRGVCARSAGGAALALAPDDVASAAPSAHDDVCRPLWRGLLLRLHGGGQGDRVHTLRQGGRPGLLLDLRRLGRLRDLGGAGRERGHQDRHLAQGLRQPVLRQPEDRGHRQEVCPSTHASRARARTRARAPSHRRVAVS